MSDTQRPEISVVIPAYNEAAVIESTLRDVFGYLKKHHLSHEVIVVDDGSTDDTVAIVSTIPEVKLIKNERNSGKGYSVRNGVLSSVGEVILFMDADNSTNIRELNHMLKEIKSWDIVIGSRALQESNVEVSQNKIKQFLGRLGNLAITVGLGLSVRDTQCGFKLFRRSTIGIFEKQQNMRFAFDFELLFQAKKRGFTIHESPVTWVNNFETSVKPIDYLLTFLEIIKIRLRDRRGIYDS